MATRPFSPGDLSNTVPAYCLDLTLGGRTYRLGTRPLDLVTDTGRVLHYADALSDPDWSDEISRQGVQDSASIPLAVYLDGEDVAELVARGHRLEAARGDLFLVLVDRDTGRTTQTRQTAYPLLTGRLAQPQYADPERHPGYLSFTLEDSGGDERSLLLDQRHIIDSQTLPNAETAYQGKVYPVIIGTPGSFRKASGEAAKTSGSPAYPYTQTGGHHKKVLVAGHEVQASTVRLFDDDAAGQDFSVQVETDGRGQLISYVDVGSASISKTSSTYFACWSSGGGLVSPLTGEAISGLGDVCVWALLKTSLKVDIERWIAEADLLNRFQISTYINSATLTPWSFVTRLLDGLPVEVRSGPNGLYPHVRVLDAAMAEGLQTIAEGPECEPVGPVTIQTQLADVVNEVTIRFAPRAKTGDFRRTITIGPEPEADDDESFPDEYAIISANRWSTDPASPVIAAESLELPHIYDDTTAALIATEMIRTQGLGYATRPYVLDVRLGWLMPGAQIRLESSSLHRTYLATVLSRRWTGTSWAVIFALDEDPIRDSSLKDY